MESSPPLPDRRCLVCGTPTASCHYGVDACRACTVFYRKALKKKLYACRSSTRRCSVTADGAIACKRCRFDRFERILLQSTAGRKEDEPKIAPSSSDVTVPQSIISGRTPRPLLDKCDICYKMMCAMRRNSELNARSNPPHPSKINAQEYEIVPSTFGIMVNSSRFLLTGILDIAEMMYPEFSTFSRDEQWTLAVSFYNRLFIFDGAYRAEKVYPDDASKALAAYTSYMSAEIVDHFFDDCPNETPNLEDAKIHMNKFIDSTLPSTRLAIRRANLDECEFNAVIILSFWFVDCLQLRDEIVRIGEKYRQDVLRELAAHYKEDLKLDDYAARIGELFMLIFNFDRSTDVEESFELYRLLGVFNDDTFVYRLHNRSE